ncbi:(d)CMP kinase [Eubacteriales bacterium OttesenSCG-928-N14]|nr:(d)CMP kinase [Eubacteriales bacterium OttesenSCG-928-N14]
MSTKPLVIAIDGPAGAGKSTASNALANELGINCLDTGALFRAFALKAMRNGADCKDAAAVVAAIEGTDLKIEVSSGTQRTILDGEDVSSLIRTPACAQGASDIGTIPRVREILTEQVREIAKTISLVVDGRDVGTAMLPNANFKFFLTATPQERARRRHLENVAKGDDTPYEEVLQQIIHRDEVDSTRKIAPLKQAEDAIVIDSTDMNPAQVLEMMLKTILEKNR